MTKENLPNSVAVAYDGTGTGLGYDLVGNRHSRQVTGSLPGVTPYIGHAFDARDRLNSGNGYTYDANGNTTTETAGATYVYDAENRLVTRTGGALTTVELAYDADGNRISKVADGITTKYLVEDRNPTGYAQVMEERDSVGTTQVRYTYGLDLISQSRNSGGTWTTNYYGYDGLGSVRYLTAANGTVTDTYTYDAFGILIETRALQGGSLVVVPANSSLLTPNSYKYTGEQLDEHLGMYYLRARYYKPELGRFWTMDSYEGNTDDPLSMHKYLYAYDNPVNGRDHSGHEFEIGGVMGVTFDQQLYFKNGRLFRDCAVYGQVAGNTWSKRDRATHEYTS